MKREREDDDDAKKTTPPNRVLVLGWQTIKLSADSTTLPTVEEREGCALFFPQSTEIDAWVLGMHEKLKNAFFKYVRRGFKKTVADFEHVSRTVVHAMDAAGVFDAFLRLLYHKAAWMDDFSHAKDTWAIGYDAIEGLCLPAQDGGSSVCVSCATVDLVAAHEALNVALAAAHKALADVKDVIMPRVALSLFACMGDFSSLYNEPVLPSCDLEEAPDVPALCVYHWTFAVFVPKDAPEL